MTIFKKFYKTFQRIPFYLLSEYLFKRRMKYFLLINKTKFNFKSYNKKILF